MEEKKSPDPIHQHYVPQCLLELFSKEKNDKDEPLLWVISKNNKKRRKSTVERIFAYNHLYTIVIDSKKVFAIEKTLANIEGDFATIYREKISKRLPLSDTEHLSLCAFVATLLQRTVGYKDKLEKNIDRMAEHVKGMGIDPAVVSKFITEQEELKKDFHKRNLIGSFPEITQILMKMNVAFFCSENSNTDFIISDDPCVLFNPKLQWQKYGGPGLLQPDIEVTVPLSKDTYLLFSWSNYRGYFYMNRSGVNDKNRMIRAHAHKEIATSNKRMKLIWRSPLPISLTIFSKFLMMQVRILYYRIRSYYLYGRRKKL